MSREETGHVRKRPRSTMFKAIGTLADYPPQVVVRQASETGSQVARNYSHATPNTEHKQIVR